MLGGDEMKSSKPGKHKSAREAAKMLGLNLETLEAQERLDFETGKRVFDE